MGAKYPHLKSQHQDFIAKQQLYFVATAPNEGWLNLSPKGIDSLRVLNENQVLWLNLTGSGNETAAHLLDDSRMTIMFCAFAGAPTILRLYGSARSIHPADEREWSQWLPLFPQTNGARQLILLEIELVHTSCGFGVPLYEYQGQREELIKWAEKKGEEGVRDYWNKKNRISMDGKPTGLFPEDLNSDG